MPLIDIIKAVQAKLGLVADGDARGKTWTAIANAIGAPASISLSDTIDSVQQKLNLTMDGDPREKTWEAIAKALGVEGVEAGVSSAGISSGSASSAGGTPAATTIPQKAIDLILEAEGVDQPWKWPEGESGITIGFGYDLGYEHTFISDWTGIIPPAAINALVSALGVIGGRAHRMAPSFRGITITREQALTVFYRHTLPQETAKTLHAFPGLDKMPPPVIGALVSLVFNRGTSFDGERRREMKNIRDLVLRQSTAAALPLSLALREIAAEFRRMKRLWAGKDMGGLITRREAEAKLVESAIS